VSNTSQDFTGIWGYHHHNHCYIYLQSVIITDTVMMMILLTTMIVICCRAEVLQGPGSNARIIPDSDRIAPDQLPLEHRGGGGLLLPDVFSISRNITSELDVDLFFSLFFVFLNDQFEESHAPFTIFAPAGLATSEATKWLATEEELTEELLLNHIVMGDHLRPELVTSWDVVRSTLGGLEVSFKIDEEGELWVNDARIVAWKEEGNALIIALEDYLFKREVQKEVGVEEYEDYENDEESHKSKIGDSEEHVPREWGDSSQDPESNPDSSRVEFVPTPRKSQKNCTKVENKSGLSIFKTITVCTEKVDVVNATDEEDMEPSLRKLDSSLSFLEEVEKELSFIRGGPGLTYFLSYANMTGLDQLLSPKQPYTVFAPVDEAFQNWHPIDWGFNPFDVFTFLNETLTNHVVEGVIVQPDSDETSLKTIGDRGVRVTVRGENTYVNGVLVRGGITLVGGRGSILFLDKVLWVDHDVVDDLNSKYGFLESGPPINYPWNNSQFLSHSLVLLENMPETSLLASYLNNTPSLGSLAPSKEEGGYTLLAPSNQALSAVIAGKEKMRLLSEHLIADSVILSDKTVVTTVSGRDITILTTPAGRTVIDDGSEEGPAAILGDPVFVYDLGYVMVIDKVLFGGETDFPTTVQTEITTTVISEEDLVNTTIEPQDTNDDISVNFQENLITKKSAITSDNTTTIDDFVKFPESETNKLEEIETTTSQEDAEDTTADSSIIVFKVKELLAEEQLADNLLHGEELIKPREKRIVYINNQRVEIEDEEAS